MVFINGSNRFSARKTSVAVAAIIIFGLSTIAMGQANWTACSGVPTTDSLYGVLSGGGKYVAVGNNGTVVTSLDAVTWTKQTSGTTNSLRALAFDGSKFVAVGKGGTIITSTNGTTWTGSTSGTTKALRGIAWGNNKFVAVGDSGTVLTSANGSAWTLQASKDTTLTSVTWGNNLFVAVGGITVEEDLLHGDAGTIQTSTDGVTWTTRRSGLWIVLKSVVWNGSKFLTFGQWETGSGDPGNYLVSADGALWLGPKDLKAVTVINGYADTSNIMQWFFSAIYAGGNFVTAGSNGTILYSATGDSLDWKVKQITGLDAKDFLGVTFGNKTYVAVGASGMIYTSPSTSVKWSGSFKTMRQQLVIEGNKASFGLEKSAAVSMKVFDMKGQLVETLLDARKSAGTHSIALPSILSQGRYIVSLKIDGSEVGRSVIVLK